MVSSLGSALPDLEFLVLVGDDEAEVPVAKKVARVDAGCVGRDARHLYMDEA